MTVRIFQIISIMVALPLFGTNLLAQQPGNPAFSSWTWEGKDEDKILTFLLFDRPVETDKDFLRVKLPAEFSQLLFLPMTDLRLGLSYAQNDKRLEREPGIDVKIREVETELHSRLKTFAIQFQAGELNRRQQRAEVKELRDWMENVMDELFTESQRKRIDELVMQDALSAGIYDALQSPWVDARLAISPEQKKDISARRQTLSDELDKKLLELIRSYPEKMLEDLTEEQRRKLDKLRGEPPTDPTERERILRHSIRKLPNNLTAVLGAAPVVAKDPAGPQLLVHGFVTKDGQGEIALAQKSPGEPVAYRRYQVTEEAARILQKTWFELLALKRITDDYPREFEISDAQQKEIEDGMKTTVERLAELGERLAKRTTRAAERKQVDEFVAEITEIRSRIFLKHQLVRIAELELRQQMSTSILRSLGSQLREELEITNEQLNDLAAKKPQLEQQFLRDVRELLDEYREKAIDPLDEHQRRQIGDRLKEKPTESPEMERSIISQLGL